MNSSESKYPFKLEGHEQDQFKQIKVQAAWKIDRTKLLLYFYNDTPPKKLLRSI
jgi:hypothetical protein